MNTQIRNVSKIRNDYRLKPLSRNTQQNNREWGIGEKNPRSGLVGISVQHTKFHPVYTKTGIEDFTLGSKFEEEIREIADLNDNWDEEGALKPDYSNLKNATLFVLKYGNSILKTFGKNLSYPEINPCKDGSIDLVWRDKTNFLILNFREPNGQIANFYFDQYDPNLGRQGGFVPSELDQDILNYLKKFV
ncbi:hypothetical protein [Aquiflexum sp.]|uniref:hypothetical protein n=1 Tax=Aquiflexum sp. TaxID=1872584 RepID=UPI00359438F1